MFTDFKEFYNSQEQFDKQQILPKTADYYCEDYNFPKSITNLSQNGSKIGKYSSPSNFSSFNNLQQPNIEFNKNCFNIEDTIRITANYECYLKALKQFLISMGLTIPQFFKGFKSINEFRKLTIDFINFEQMLKKQHPLIKNNFRQEIKKNKILKQFIKKITQQYNENLCIEIIAMISKILIKIKQKQINIFKKNNNNNEKQNEIFEDIYYCLEIQYLNMKSIDIPVEIIQIKQGLKQFIKKIEIIILDILSIGNINCNYFQTKQTTTNNNNNNNYLGLPKTSSSYRQLWISDCDEDDLKLSKGQKKKHTLWQ